MTPTFPCTGGIFAHNDLLLNIDANQVGMGGQHTCQCFFNDIFWLVNQFFHRSLLNIVLPDSKTQDVSAISQVDILALLNPLNFLGGYLCLTTLRKASIMACCCSDDHRVLWP